MHLDFSCPSIMPSSKSLSTAVSSYQNRYAEAAYAPVGDAWLILVVVTVKVPKLSLAEYNYNVVAQFLSLRNVPYSSTHTSFFRSF